MWERIEPRMREIAKRAGVADVPPGVVAAALVLCALACVWALWRWWPSSSDAVGAAAGGAAGPGSVETSASVEAAPSEGVSEVSCLVHVVGAVRRPGVYELAAGSRVDDAVRAAGGLLPDAVVMGVNLARVIVDGEQIVVPDADTPQVPVATGGVGAASGAAAARININSADAALLDTLPGVGPSTAAKIIAEREAGGPFKSVEDLGRVSGIGPKRLEELKDLVSAQ